MIKIILLTFVLASIWGHGGKDHIKSQKLVLTKTEETLLNEKYAVINISYLKKVKHLLRRSCFDCHGDNNYLPWYYIIPGVKQLIDNDIKESKKHLDFTNDFPFKSHETPIRDLEEISKSISTNSMPPFRYRIMHRDIELNDDEKRIIQKWIRESRELLNE